MFGILSMLSLVAGMMWLGIQRIWGGFSAKDYFLSARIAIVAGAVFSLMSGSEAFEISYLSVGLPEIRTFILTSAIAYIWLSLSLKWFTAEDMPACLFCFLALTALLCCQVIASAVDFGILFGAMAVLALVNYLFLYISQQTEELHHISSRYGLIALFFVLLAASSLFFLLPENWNFRPAAAILSTFATLKAYFVLAGILFIFLFMLALAPLHFWFADVIAPAVLPVAFYFNLIPLLSLWTAFAKLNLEFLTPWRGNLDEMYLVLGVLSVFAGAIGANTSRNLKKIFACSGIYNLGIMLLMVSSFTDEAVLSAMVYMQTYVLALTGIYTVFYAFKSRGDYLYNLNMVSGFAKVRPFAAGALLFFMASLAGLAPFPGFWPLWGAFEIFARGENSWLIFSVLGGMILLVPAYLQVAKAVCFNKKSANFDRTENNVYFCLVVLMIFLLLFSWRPQLWNTMIQWNVLAG